MKKNLGSFKIVILILLFFGTLQSMEYNSSIDVKQFIDNENSYPLTAFEYRDILSYLYAIFIFLAGFLTSKFDLLNFYKRGIQKESSINNRIEHAKDKKELLKILILSKDNRYKRYIKILEESIYGGKDIDFLKLKEELSTL